MIEHLRESPLELGRLKGIQIMRYVAAVGVLLVHIQWKLKQYYDYTMVPHISNTAIDLFFIISGYVIALVLRDQTVKPLNFLWRRIKRIYPPYFLLTCAAWGVFLVLPEQVNSSGGVTNVLASFILWPGPYKFLIENAWTLPHEFIFYGIAMGALFFRRWRQVILLMMLLSVWFLEYLLGESMEKQFVMIDFLTGVCVFHLAAWLTARGIRVTNTAALIFPLILGALSFASYFNKITSLQFLGVNLMWAACLLLVSLIDFASYGNRFFDYIAGLGDRSYSIYLTHPF